MALFRKKETYNEQMLREAGLDRIRFREPVTEPARAAVTPDEPALDPKAWDAAETVDAPGLAGDEVKFTTLPNGDVIVAEETGDGDLSQLAEAIELHLEPPYRAIGTRQEGRSDRWTVVARRIKVASIPYPVGERLQFSVRGRGRNGGTSEEFLVDGEPADMPVPPELRALGRFGSGALGVFVDAVRIDGDLWEFRVT